MPVIFRSPKEPLGRATEQTIMTACRKFHQYNTIMKTLFKKKKKKSKKTTLCVNNSVSTSCKKNLLANDIYNVLWLAAICYCCLIIRVVFRQTVPDSLTISRVCILTEVTSRSICNMGRARKELNYIYLCNTYSWLPERGFVSL